MAASPGSIDEHGQPNPHFNAARRSERDLTELLGIAKGMIADGIVTQDEANYLRAWADGHAEAVNRWPLSLVFGRLRQFFADGRIDEAERAELQELLSSLVGGNLAIQLGHDAASSLPLDVPAPRSLGSAKFTYSRVNVRTALRPSARPSRDTRRCLRQDGYTSNDLSGRRHVQQPRLGADSVTEED